MKKTLLRTISCLLTLTLLLCGLSSCTAWDNFYNAFIHKKPQEDKLIRIAVFEPLTGEYASAAADEIAGIELAQKLFPTVLDATVELVYFDNKSDPDTAKELAQEIAADETIKLVLGSYGNTMTVAAGDIFEEAGLPAIAITCTNPLITNTNTNYARVSPVDSFEALGAAEFLAVNLGITNACALYQAGNDLSRTRAEAFVSAFSKYKGNETPSLYAISFAEGESYDALFEEIVVYSILALSFFTAFEETTDNPFGYIFRVFLPFYVDTTMFLVFVGLIILIISGIEQGVFVVKDRGKTEAPLDILGKRKLDSEVNFRHPLGVNGVTSAIHHRILDDGQKVSFDRPSDGKAVLTAICSDIAYDFGHIDAVTLLVPGVAFDSRVNTHAVKCFCIVAKHHFNGTFCI